MSMQTSQFLKLVNSSEIQKYKYIENETLFFHKKKVITWYIKGCSKAKDNFLVEVIFKALSAFEWHNLI